VGRLRYGTSTWGEKSWVGPFYPPGTRPADFLTVYADAFDAVEADNTDRRRSESSRGAWSADQAPPSARHTSAVRRALSAQVNGAATARRRARAAGSAAVSSARPTTRASSAASTRGFRVASK
jgi:hypothetical protein